MKALDPQNLKLTQRGFVGENIYYREHDIVYPKHSFKTCGGTEVLTSTTIIKTCSGTEVLTSTTITKTCGGTEVLTSTTIIKTCSGTEV